tara:strand:+ start:291 stop:2810 length:2520 start_codon:yes stop_codon:yes gene_type:complete
MIDLLQERRASHQTRQDPHEIVINEGGAYVDVPRVEGQAFYPGGDAPKKEYTGTAMERTGEALGDLAQTTGSMAVGTAAGVAGLPGDVASLIGGLSSLLFPGDQGRIEAATETMTKISDSIGSERFLGMYKDFINNQADLSQEDKKMMLDAAEVGSFMSIPGAGAAAKGSKDAIVEGAQSFAAGAPLRAAERKGTVLTSGVDPTALIDDIIVGMQKKQAVARVQEIAKARSPDGKVTVDDLHKFFDEVALKKHGRKLNVVDNPDDYQTVKNELKQDILLQSKANVSGKGWYDEDVRKTFATFANMPGFEKLKDNETHRVLFSAILGVTSPGPKVAQNTRAGAAQYLQYIKTGKFSTEAPPPGTPVAGIEKAGFGQYGYPQGLKMLQHLLDTLGEDGVADFLLSPHTKGELIAIRKAAGFKSDTVSGMGGKADRLHFGAAIFGDKAGKFVLNINGYPATTKDKWFVRSIRRAEGTHGDNTVIQKDRKKGTEKVVEYGQPRNIAERQVMDKMVAELVKDADLADLKLSEQDAQAILWFREQNLYTDLGVLSRPQTFSEGAELVSGQKGFGVRGGDETKAAIESGTADLPGFRGVSGSKRAVRSNRRQQLESLNNRGDKETTSGPYGRDSEQDDGRVRSLVPNVDVQAKYENAGLRMPTIEIKSIDHASEYFDAIKSAMSKHKYGAQVELKSVEELQGLTMHRTSDGGGFALKPDGDIVAVFSPDTAPRGGIYATLQAAIEAGGRKLDAFDTMLPDIYETVGFRPVARVKWNDEFAPKPPFAAKAWDKKTFSEFNNGEPDIILFVYDPKYFGGVDKNSLTLFDDFDEAAKIQDAELAKMGGG